MTLKFQNFQFVFISYHCVKSVQIRRFSGPYFPVFSLNTRKYGPEKTPYLATFHAVYVLWKFECNCMHGLFCIADLSELGRKNYLFWFYFFHWAAKMKQSITIMNLKKKVFILKRHRNSWKWRQTIEILYPKKSRGHIFTPSSREQLRGQAYRWEGG